MNKSNASEISANENPIVFLGAGPGAPDLLTVRGKRVLERADLVVYAGSLVPKAVTEYAPEDAEVISSASLTLDEILEEMDQAYRDDRQVVRLHSGDPSLYGAIQEQMVYFDREDIPYVIVPGVSSFLAAAARLQSELTIPEKVQTVTLSRASGRADAPDRESLDKLAQSQGTLCVFLSAKHASRVQEMLLEHYAPDTPAAVCYKVTRPEEKVKVTELDTLAPTVRDLGLKRTTLFMVGDAIEAREDTRSGVYDPDHLHIFRPE